MNWEEKLYNTSEKPLDTLVNGYSRTSVFRKIAFVGDSMSSGEFETHDADGETGYHDFLEYSWGQHIARKNGITAYSFSRGGMTAKEYMESFAEEKGFWDKEKAAQAYVIALGVNDVCNAHMEIGSLDDVKSDYRKNGKTYMGYYAQIVSRYKEISPEAKFFFVTIPNDPDYNTRGDVNKVNDALYELADHFENAYIIDLYKYGPEFDERFAKQFFMYGHMNPSGYIFIAEMVDSYIDYIVRHNPDDFEMVAFGNDIQSSWQFIKR